jgi:hypothetical protein
MSNEKQWKITNANNTGSIEIIDDGIVFNEKTTAAALLAGRGVQGRKSIPICNITAIQLKRGGFLSPGFIHFSYVGGKEFRGGLFEATRDPDTMLFNEARNDAVEAFAAEVERRRAEYQRNATTTVPTISGDVEKLAALKAAGALTEEEFTIAKRKLLAE